MTDLEQTIARSGSGDATALPDVAYRTQPFKPSAGSQELNLYPGSALFGMDWETFRWQEATFALLNLAMNAVEASAPGGTVVLRAKCSEDSVKIDLENGNGPISESAVLYHQSVGHRAGPGDHSQHCLFALWLAATDGQHRRTCSIHADLARSGDRGGHNESVNLLWAGF